MATSAYILNPILSRELRARWRGGRSLVLVFSYVAILASLAALVYATSSINNDSSTMNRQMARVGHDLFLLISGLQIFGWLLISPALTATSIASERERGLLEMLQLTPLSPARICAGKLGSALLLVILLAFAPLPITSLCFMMGGVSPAEFFVAFALQIATIGVGLCLGLWASARARRATSAMTQAFVSAGIWFFATGVISIWAIAGARGTKSVSGILALDEWLVPLLDFVWRTNPLIVFLVSVSPPSRTFLSWFDTYFGWTNVPDWMLCCGALALLSAVLYWSATRTLRRFPGEIGADELALKPPRAAKSARKRIDKIDVSDVSPVAALDIEYSISNDAAISSARNAKKTSVPQGFAWDWKFLRDFRASNPMLQHEVRKRARVRIRASRWQRVFGALVVGLLLLWGSAALYANLKDNAIFVWIIATIIAFISMLCFSAFQGALCLTREFEAGTWEGIQLSLLSAHEILWGKLLPLLATALLFGLVLWTPTLLCLDGVVVQQDKYSKLSPPLFFGVIAIACGASWLFLSLGIFVSTLMKRIWPAVAWTFGILIVFNIALPLLLEIALPNFYIYRSTVADFFRFWQPTYALSALSDSQSWYRQQDVTVAPIIILEYLLTTFLIGALFLSMAHQRLQRLLETRTGLWPTPRSSALSSTERSR